jgi:hypothetical protein
VYAREIEGEEFTFGVSGKLIRNVLVMYDRQTESLWSQLLGESVSGEMLGTKLEFLPSWHTTWGQWKEMHPETVALEKGFRGSHDPYEGYYQSGSSGVIGEAFVDPRLLNKEFVIGLELEETAIAYPFRVLNSEPVVNDTAGDNFPLVVFDRLHATGVIFDRQLGDQILTFTLSDPDPLTINDLETGSTWDAMTGEAIDGPLAGQKLARLKSTLVFWFGWKDFHTDTLVYGIEALTE